jgi:hypothetical protein
MSRRRNRAVVSVFGSLCVAVGFLGVPLGPTAVAAAGPEPALEAVYASGEISPHGAWEIYLKGNDPQGTMEFIHIWLYVPGVPTTPVRLPVGPSERQSIDGYVVLYASDLGVTPDNYFGPPIGVMVTLENKAGYQSQSLMVRATFDPQAKKAAPPGGVFQARYLGTVPGDLKWHERGIGPGLGGFSR